MYSFKPWFIPERDELIHFSPQGIQQPKEGKPVAFVGLHLEDILALLVLDKALLGEHKDATYERRRKSTLIVGISKEQYHEHSFTPYRTLDIFEGYDLFLNRTDNGYLVVHGSDRGGQLTNTLHFFENTDLELPTAETPQHASVLSDPQKLQQAIEKSITDEMWEEIAQTCIGCGICTFVCPL